jgi:hypothetical protein
MQTIDVKVNSIDHSTRFLYPNRTVLIRPSSSTNINTPTRAATDYEFRQKTVIPTPIPLRNPIYISTENLSLNKFEKFVHKNGYYDIIRTRTEVKSRQAQHALVRLFLLRPTITDKRDKVKRVIYPSPMRLLKENHLLLERFIRLIIHLQSEVGLNPITIPFFELPFQEWEKQVIEIDKSIEMIGNQPVFFLDMAYPEIDKALDLLVNKLQLNIVGLYFKPYRRATVAYEALRNYVEKNVAFITVNVDRTDIKNTMTMLSTMHYLPFFGNDICAIKRPMGFQKKIIDQNGNIRTVPFDYSIMHINLFDKQSLCIQPIRQAQATMNRLTFEYKNDTFIPQILANYETANGAKAQYEVLNAFSKVSELKDSTSEFGVFQQYINQNSAKDYVEQKDVLKLTIPRVIKTPSANLQIKKWFG